MMGALSVAFVHEWLTTMGGSEKILEAMLEVWPEAPVHALVYDPLGQCKGLFDRRLINTSFIQKLPFAKRNHRAYLPLMPIAVEQFDLRDYDVVISCSHAVAHGIIPRVDQMHINYICTPMRYAWHLYHEYLHETGLRRGPRGWITKIILHYMRLWDTTAANRVDHFVAISNWMARTVWRAYRRQSDVIYPPVDIDAFEARNEKEDFYITVSRLVPYKKVDLIVEAFSGMPERKLVVIGDGPDLGKLRARAGKNIEFLGFQPFETLRDCMQRARAFVYAAVEDFGIVPVEAQACGTPVIAYGKGGVLETVIKGKTGLFFSEQSAESLRMAIDLFEREEIRFDICQLREQAEKFNKDRFQKQFEQFVGRKWASFINRNH